ncbi:TPA: hypothetical protein L4R46_003744 [Escherichia coli]|nr:hypothetical protein [Escherichia coli]
MHNLLNSPLPVSMDLFQAGEMCGHFVARLTDESCVDETERVALCGRLAFALRSLSSLCDTDYPSHIQAQLTATAIPAPCVPDEWIDATILTGYCTALNDALLSRSLRMDVETQLRWLLHDMINVLVRYLKQPCIKAGVDHV